MIDRADDAAADQPSAARQRLQRALDDRGIDARVEEREALAIIVPRLAEVSPDESASDVARSTILEVDTETRRWLVQAAVAAGYSHVALELDPPPSADAALPGRHPA